MRTTFITLFCILWAFSGCTKEHQADSIYGNTASDLLLNPGPDHIDGDDCTILSVEANGRDLNSTNDPRVGDFWTLRMFCDGVLMTGANLLKFTPPHMATVAPDMTDATFTAAGEATMLLQSGNIQYTTDLMILPAE